MEPTEQTTPPGFGGMEQRQNTTQRLNDLVKIFEELKGNRNSNQLF